MRLILRQTKLWKQKIKYKWRNMLKENDENLNGMILLIQEYSCSRKGFFSHESAKKWIKDITKVEHIRQHNAN